MFVGLRARVSCFRGSNKVSTLRRQESPADAAHFSPLVQLPGRRFVGSATVSRWEMDYELAPRAIRDRAGRGPSVLSADTNSSSIKKTCSPPQAATRAFSLVRRLPREPRPGSGHTLQQLG
jgi:hypothetical protein